MIPAGAISADSHVVEPANCYVDHIDPKYRDDAPRIIEQPDGSDAFLIAGMKRPVGLGLMDGAGFGPKVRNKRMKTLKAADVRPGGFQDDWTAFQTAHLMSEGQLLWASDFPHTDSTWPHSQELLAKHTAHLSEAQRQAIMRDNVARVFNLPAGDASWRMHTAA
jgi:hypothetical protein